ncbi:DNA polymerase III, partial [bacterium]
MDNTKIAEIFRNMAKLLEIKGDNPFKIRAYFNAADIIESLNEDAGVLIKESRLTQIKGIGKDLAEKAAQILKSGSFKEYQQLKKEIPKGVVEMLDIPGLGPKTVRLIYEKLKVKDIDTLEKAVLSGRLRQAGRIKEKTEENILKGIRLLKEGKGRQFLYYALGVAEDIVSYLRKMPGVKEIEIAGSLRRRKKTVKDIDILVVGPQKVMDYFSACPLVKEVIVKGPLKTSVRLNNNMQVDLRLVKREEFGAALLYFTGSKEFNIALRGLAQKKGYKINEYGLFEVKSKAKKKTAGKTEKGIFSRLNLEFIPAVLRENRGEIAAAAKGAIPELINLQDIKGDFHIHSNYSDGSNSLEEIARAGREKGYEYMGICDHSQSLKVASGLSVEKLKEKIRK